jgi:hypothetical protein
VSEEYTVKVPCSEETYNIEDAVEEHVGSEAWISGIFGGGLITMGYNN